MSFGEAATKPMSCMSDAARIVCAMPPTKGEIADLPV